MIITADWHIGAVNPNDFLNELEDTLFKKLDEMVEACETLDAIFVVGDIFDSKQYFARFFKAMRADFKNQYCDSSSSALQYPHKLVLRQSILFEKTFRAPAVGAAKKP